MKKLFFKRKGQTSLTISFKLVNNLIIIPVSINDSDILNFILDTGLSTTILTDLRWNDSVSLIYARQVQLQGIGEGSPVEALHSYGNTIRISDITGKNQDLYVLLDNNFDLSARMGISINGILGYSVFRDFIVAINFARKKITFYEPESYEYKRRYRRYKTLPLQLHDTKSYIDAQITDDKGMTHNVKLLIDTGASHAIWLDKISMQDLDKTENRIHTFLGVGLSGPVSGEIERMQLLQINDIQLKKPIVSFPDSSSIFHASGMDQRNGSIGSDVLRRFNLLIDYTNSRISIRPNQYFRKPFTQNLSGMEIIAPYTGLNLYFVDDVSPGSPAWNAGIRSGDELIAINNIPTTKLEMSDIYNIIQSRPGRRIRVRFYREGKLIPVTFRLEEFI